MRNYYARNPSPHQRSLKKAVSDYLQGPSRGVLRVKARQAICINVKVNISKEKNNNTERVMGHNLTNEVCSLLDRGVTQQFKPKSPTHHVFVLRRRTAMSNNARFFKDLPYTIRLSCNSCQPQDWFTLVGLQNECNCFHERFYSVSMCKSSLTLL